MRLSIDDRHRDEYRPEEFSAMPTVIVCEVPKFNARNRQGVFHR